jgi:hypothetical protein
MPDEAVAALVEQAVRMAYDRWAGRHPSLAAVIDRIRLQEMTAERLRDSQGYRDAVAAYQDAAAQGQLAGRLLDLAETLLTTFLGA